MIQTWKLYSFFLKNLNENTGTQDDEENLINIDTSDDDEILNSSITEAEILKCLQLLKSNKCSTNGSIVNEYLKHSSGKMLLIYILFFKFNFRNRHNHGTLVRGHNKAYIQT